MGQGYRGKGTRRGKGGERGARVQGGGDKKREKAAKWGGGARRGKGGKGSVLSEVQEWWVDLLEIMLCNGESLVRQERRVGWTYLMGSTVLFCVTWRNKTTQKIDGARPWIAVGSRTMINSTLLEAYVWLYRKPRVASRLAQQQPNVYVARKRSYAKKN